MFENGLKKVIEIGADWCRLGLGLVPRSALLHCSSQLRRRGNATMRYVAPMRVAPMKWKRVNRAKDPVPVEDHSGKEHSSCVLRTSRGV